MASTVPDDEYQAPAFVMTKVIEAINNSPRFGHLNDIGLAASSNSEIREDYITGVVFMSAITFIFFIVWVIILIVLDCLGQSRIGCASGEPPVYPKLNSLQGADRQGGEEPRNNFEDEDEHHDVEREDGIGVESAVRLEHNEEDSENNKVDVREIAVRAVWLQELESTKKRIKRVRIAFIVAGITLIVTSGVLFTKGIMVLNDAYKSTLDDVKQMNDVIVNNIFETVSSTEAAVQARNTRDTILTNLPTWCPNAVDNSITVSSDALLSEPEKVTLNDNGDGTVTLSFENLTSSFEKDLLSMQTFAVEGHLNVHGALSDAQYKADEIDNQMSKYTWWYYVAFGIMIVVDIFSLVFVAGVISAWRGTMSNFFVKMQKYFAMPIFTILINLLWLSVCGFMIAAVLSADTCAGSPDENVISIFNHQEESMDPLLFGMTTYYVGGCKEIPSQVQSMSYFDPILSGGSSEGKPTAFLDTYLSFIEDAGGFTADFMDGINSVETWPLAGACGENVTDFLNTVTLFRATLAATKIRTTSLVQGLYCSNINPIYVNLMHENVCYDAVEAFAVIFSTLLVISVCGMIMITLRVSWNEVSDEIGTVQNNVELEEPPTAKRTIRSHDVTNNESEGQLTHVSVRDDTTEEHPDFSPRRDEVY